MELWLQIIAPLSKENAYIGNFKGTQVDEIEVLIIFGFKCRYDRCVGGHSRQLRKIGFGPFVDERLDLPFLLDIDGCDAVDDVEAEAGSLHPNIQGIKISVQVLPGNRQGLDTMNEFWIFISIEIGSVVDVVWVIGSDCILWCWIRYKSNCACSEVRRKESRGIWREIGEQFRRYISWDRRQRNEAARRDWRSHGRPLWHETR